MSIGLESGPRIRAGIQHKHWKGTPGEMHSGVRPLLLKTKGAIFAVENKFYYIPPNIPLPLLSYRAYPLPLFLHFSILSTAISGTCLAGNTRRQSKRQRAPKGNERQGKERRGCDTTRREGASITWHSITLQYTTIHTPIKNGALVPSSVSKRIKL